MNVGSLELSLLKCWQILVSPTHHTFVPVKCPFPVIQHFEILGARRPADGNPVERLCVGRDESDRSLGKVHLPGHDRREDGVLQGRRMEEARARTAVYPTLHDEPERETGDAE